MQSLGGTGPARERVSARDVTGPFGVPSPGGPVLYPNAYTWYVLMAAMDIMCTWIILHTGGSELNALADWVIQRYDLPGVVSYKFGLVVMVVLICELAGRRNRQTGLKLACWAVAITAFPVVVGLVEILAIVADRAG